MGQNKKSKTKLLYSFLSGAKKFFVLCILSSLLASLFELVCPKIISFTVDSVIGTEEAVLPEFLDSLVAKIGGVGFVRENLWTVAVVIIIVALLMGAAKYAEAVFNRLGSETLVENMRNRLFHHIERIKFSWFSKNQTGDIIQRCTSDVETVKAFLSEQLTSIISTTLLIVLSLVFMFFINTTLALIALFSIPVIVTYSLLFHNKIGDSFEKCDENEGKLSSIVQENLTGVRVVRAFGREKYEVEKYKKQNGVYTDMWVRLGFILSMFWSTGDIISGIQVMIVLVVGTVLTVEGTISVGDFIAAVSYNSMLTWPVRSLGRVISEMSKAGISIGRIADVMFAEEEKDPENPVIPEEYGDISFENVSFSYDGSAEILHNVSMKIKKGTTVGILGTTGSGKSTLLSLLTKLYELPEDSGKITVSGIDIRSIPNSELRKNIGIVLQEPFLFSRTLKENIGICFDDITEHGTEIERAVHAASLTETIEKFTKGYDTMVGERGVTLSGGQKQRTAIARLLVSGCKVMIFDDSLSAVDSETDAKIRASLAELSDDTTVIIVSHRIQTLMSADEIFVFSDGSIVESGKHDELLKYGGIYKKISDIQGLAGEEGEI